MSSLQRRNANAVFRTSTLALAPIACALSLELAACGGAQPALRIRVPQETVATGRPEPPLPDAPRSRVAVALEVKLDAVRAQIEAALPTRQEQPWTLVTREGASPRIELRVTVERDPVALIWKDGRLRTEVQLRYWAKVRGAVKSPLPWQRNHWFDLDGDQTWGTQEEPQRTRLVVKTEVKLDEQGELHVQSAAKPIEPGAPPAGSFCVDAGIRICVDKATFEGEVKNAFKQRIEPALTAAVEQVDRQLERSADLRPRLAQAWAQLQCPYALERGVLRCDPQPSERGTWLQWRPEGLAASPLASSGKLLHVTIGLEGALEVTRGEPPAAQRGALPAIALRAPKSGFELHVPVAFDYDLITSQLATALPSKALPIGKEGQVHVTQARVAGADPSAAERLLLELHLAGAVDAVIYVSAALRVADLELGFKALAYTPQTQRRFADPLAEVDHAAFLGALQGALRVKLAPLSDVVTGLATAALSGDTRIEPSARITKIALSEVQLGDRSLSALLTLRGRLKVRIRP